MINGVLNVYKEKGYTSHDVVAKLRGITGQKKIGHTGTLDPDAAGVLPVCFGKATKLCDMLKDWDKCYEAGVLLGTETDTQDISGNVIEKKDTSDIRETVVKEAVKSFQGGYEQVPPMYSALKVNGRKLYELAREGRVVERKARRIEIYELEILEMSLPRLRIRVHCSKGTYIRTLCHDIGKKLGCGACMEKLIRTRAGQFRIEESLRLSEIERMKKEERLEEVLIPVDQMFLKYPSVTVKKEWQKAACNGNALPEAAVLSERMVKEQEQVRVYVEKGEFIGIYRFQEEQGEYTVVKMFYLEERDQAWSI